MFFFKEQSSTIRNSSSKKSSMQEGIIRSISCPKIETLGHSRRISESLKRPLIEAASPNRDILQSARSSSLIITKKEPDVREVMDNHFKKMAQNTNYANTGTDWYKKNKKIKVWTFNKNRKIRNVKSVTGQRPIQKTNENMINVKSIKKLYDELVGIPSNIEAEDLELKTLCTIKNKFQDYIKRKSAQETNFLDFMKFLYPNLKEKDLAKIQECTSY